MDLTKLKQVVGELNSAEKKKLLDHLALSVKDTTHRRHLESRDLDLWCQCLGAAIQRDLGTLGVSVPNMMTLKRTIAPTFDGIDMFMTASGLQKLRVPERQAVYTLLARLLVAHAKRVAVKVHAPLSIKFVAGCSNVIPGLFEESFPGYIEAGLARVVALRMARMPATV